MYYLGIDVGGSKILGGLFEENGTLITTSKQRSKTKEGSTVVLKQLQKVIMDLTKSINIEKEVCGIGIGIAGIVDSKNGILITSPNIGLEDFNLIEFISEKYNVPVAIENDVNVGVIGEWKYGIGKGYSDIIGVFVGTGIGGGLILNNKLYKGTIGAAGEIGHMKVIENGVYCGCGLSGCLEAYSSKTGITKYFKAQKKHGEESVVFDMLLENKNKLKSSHLAKAYKLHDKVTIEALNKATKMLGSVIGSTINLLNPQLIIFGGGVMEELGEFLLDDIKSEVKKSSMSAIYASCKFELAELADFAGIYGAMDIIKEQLSEK